jgi:pseudaminic acid biosynthesis-associated methylase
MPAPKVDPRLETWKGAFGDEYIKRNRYEPWKLEPGTHGYNRMLGNIDVGSVLEVGCNIGLNLRYLRSALGPDVAIHAVEPNTHHGDGFSLPMEANAIDLVFTSGVLIHIAPEDLPAMTSEIVRVASRYVLCIEYFSREPVGIRYRDHDGLLFKRDFGSFYLDNYPELSIVDHGFFWKRALPTFDDMNWWLFAKNAAPK